MGPQGGLNGAFPNVQKFVIGDMYISERSEISWAPVGLHECHNAGCLNTAIIAREGISERSEMCGWGVCTFPNVQKCGNGAAYPPRPFLSVQKNYKGWVN